MHSVGIFFCLDVVAWFLVWFPAMFVDKQGFATTMVGDSTRVTGPGLSRADNSKPATDTSGLARNKKNRLVGGFFDY
jgi:hypothetical protein